MSTYFITRHAGAHDWAAEIGLTVDQVLDHLDPAVLLPGDCVIGVLPVHLAAEVCRRGARYLHLSLDLPPEARGRELSAAEMRAYGARVEEFVVVGSDGRKFPPVSNAPRK
jgi:CRISPR-associated protein Csx16